MTPKVFAEQYQLQPDQVTGMKPSELCLAAEKYLFDGTPEGFTHSSGVSRYLCVAVQYAFIWHYQEEGLDRRQALALMASDPVLTLVLADISTCIKPWQSYTDWRIFGLRAGHAQQSVIQAERLALLRKLRSVYEKMGQ